jgi:predicted MFS family arabinose efflux permease
MLGMVLIGHASMLFAITANSTLQRFTRPDMRGRVMSLYTTIFLGSTAIGGPITGWAAERFGVPAAFVASGAVGIIAGIWALGGRTADRSDATAGTAARSP